MSDGRSRTALERRVAWREGMHLHPQHFQQQDRALLDHAHFLLGATDPYPWGLVDIEFDADQLAHGIVRVARLEALLESGLVIDAGPGSIADRDLRALEGEEASGAEAGLDPLSNRHRKGTRFPLFVGVRRESETANTFSETEGEATRRFRIDPLDLADLTQEQATQRRVEVMRPQARLLFEGEAERENCEAIPIALVESTGDPQAPYRMVPDYAPPVVTLRAAPELFAAVDGLLKRMRRRVPELARRTAQIDAGDVRWLFARYTLVRMIAILEHQLSSGRARPFEIFTSLVDAAASLVSMETLEVPELPTFDPLRLGERFGTLIAAIDEELERSWTDRFRKIPLAYRFDAANLPDRIYEAALSTDLQKPGNTYYLAVQQPQEVTVETIDAVIATRKAGTPADVPFLVEESLTGIAFKERDTPPAEISGPKGFLYYELDPQLDANSRDQWKEVMSPNGAFAVHLGPLEELEAVLYVVFPKEG